MSIILDCRTFWLDPRYSQLSDSHCVAFGQLPRLKHLNLESNQIHDFGVQYLGQCVALTELNLNWNFIGLEGVRYLTTLTKLTCLGIRNAKLYSQLQLQEAVSCLALLGRLEVLNGSNIYNSRLGVITKVGMSDLDGVMARWFGILKL